MDKKYNDRKVNFRTYCFLTHRCLWNILFNMTQNGLSSLPGWKNVKGLNSAPFERLLLNCPLHQLKQKTIYITLATGPTGTNLFGLIYGTLKTAASPRSWTRSWSEERISCNWGNRLTSVTHSNLACRLHWSSDAPDTRELFCLFPTEMQVMPSLCTRVCPQASLASLPIFRTISVKHSRGYVITVCY